LRQPSWRHRIEPSDRHRSGGGKNPVSHVGKIYTLLTHRMAGEICANVPGLHEVYIWLCSQIGKPIDQPLIASAKLVLQHDVALVDLLSALKSVVAHGLAMNERLHSRRGWFKLNGRCDSGLSSRHLDGSRLRFVSGPMSDSWRSHLRAHSSGTPIG